jgi:hypothetical protein
VVSSDDGGVTFDIDGSEKVVAYDDLPAGRVQVEFGRSGGPGMNIDPA